ncbi:hypothetical protein QBC39DRAFT_386162 [Podospora conica]|nr:hypothetical protein QBC39DRAFT_386162 [Schizothecium conicum]
MASNFTGLPCPVCRSPACECLFHQGPNLPGAPGPAPAVEEPQLPGKRGRGRPSGAPNVERGEPAHVAKNKELVAKADGRHKKKVEAVDAARAALKKLTDEGAAPERLVRATEKLAAATEDEEKARTKCDEQREKLKNSFDKIAEKDRKKALRAPRRHPAPQVAPPAGGVQPPVAQLPLPPPMAPRQLDAVLPPPPPQPAVQFPIPVLPPTPPDQQLLEVHMPDEWHAELAEIVKDIDMDAFMGHNGHTRLEHGRHAEQRLAVVMMPLHSGQSWYVQTASVQ